MRPQSSHRCTPITSVSHLCPSVANVLPPPGRTETFLFLFEEFIAEFIRSELR